MTAPFNDGLLAAMPMLFAAAMKLTRNRSAAEDLLQDTLERALRHEESFKPGTNLAAWLFVILKNGFINDSRKAARRPTVQLDPDLSPAAVISPARQEDAVFVSEIMAGSARFPMERRVAFYLAGEGEKYETIAEIQQVPVGTVRSRISRTRSDLMAWAEGC
ncbi:MAG TPA: sigma-70 family RNA polymerase sigma factor [Dongiaceae bacterium]|nr:sigma-70 family RNA polymerase sigma factor [Dongiaceae bacterium]